MMPLASSGDSSSRASSSLRGMRSRRQGASERTVAALGSPSSTPSSPNVFEGPSRPTSPPSFTTESSPSTTTYRSSEGSPCFTTSTSGSTSSNTAISATG